MESHAFLSYARSDSAFALDLAEDLKRAGFAIWIDQIDIAPGERWDKSVETALADASAMIVILSSASVESNNVNDEVALFIEGDRLVIPVLKEECKIPFRLRRLQYVDFRTSTEIGKRTLAHRLTEIKEGRAVSSVPPGPVAVGVKAGAAVGDGRISPSRKLSVPMLVMAALVACAIAAYGVWSMKNAHQPETIVAGPVAAQVLPAASTAVAPRQEPAAPVPAPATAPALAPAIAPALAPAIATPAPSRPASASETAIPSSAPVMLPTPGRAKPDALATPVAKAASAAPISVAGNYKGNAVNLTAGKTAAIELRISEADKQLSGALTVSPPLGGSGPLTGRRNGRSVKFQVYPSDGSMRISFQGVINGARMVGTYQVTITPEARLRHPNAIAQDGNWEVTR